ncbi:MAG: DEAD/DEAH box helicase, partial [Acidobacteriota bacterium]
MTFPATSSRIDPPQFAQVAVPVHLTKTFTYRLPPSMQSVAQVGSRVMVQLGRKPTTGYIVALLPCLRSGTSLIESEIKEVQELLDVDPPLTPEVLEITRWVSDYYAAPWGEVLRAALPAGINVAVEQMVSIAPLGRDEVTKLENNDDPTVKTRALRLLADEGEFEVNAFSLRMGSAKPPKWLRDLEQAGLVERSYRAHSTPTRAKRRRAVRLINSETADPQTEGVRTTGAQQRVLDALRNHHNQMAVVDLLKTAHISDSAIRTLLKKGIVEEFQEDVRRDPLARAELPDTEEFKLTSAQIAALQAIEEPMKEGRFATMLLHGVTGSGKTEVYLRAMRDALRSGGGAIMLVPEIALTPILSRRLRANFGDQIAIFHSSLSKGERFDEWSRLRSGEARVALGTRSAIFAPVQNLRLIVIDEEHDTSYRQEESPFYNARDTAIVR